MSIIRNFMSYDFNMNYSIAPFMDSSPVHCADNQDQPIRIATLNIFRKTTVRPVFAILKMFTKTAMDVIISLTNSIRCMYLPNARCGWMIAIFQQMTISDA